MQIYQTVDWINMPEPLREQFKKDHHHYFKHYTYFEWYSWDYEYEDEPEDGITPEDTAEEQYIKSVDAWLVSQGVDLKKPILILVDW